MLRSPVDASDRFLHECQFKLLPSPVVERVPRGRVLLRHLRLDWLTACAQQADEVLLDPASAQAVQRLVADKLLATACGN